LLKEIRASSDSEFLRHHAQGGVGSDEVHSPNPAIAFNGEEQVPQKH
jgi:hypothetical protein